MQIFSQILQEILEAATTSALPITPMFAAMIPAASGIKHLHFRNVERRAHA
jgi:hypothetical protein